MRRVSLAVVLAATLGTLTGATAQTYPSRPITMIVPFAAGGPNDTIGRILAERMRAPLGQPVVIENVVGANGTIGVGRAARAAPDGYTLGIGGLNSRVVNGAVYALAYDVLRDFEPVALLSSSGGGLIVARKSMPADDLMDLIARLKASPGTATAGSPGIGSTVQLSGILFQNMTGTRFQQVPYRGGAPAMQDLVAGQIDMMIAADVTTSAPQVRAGTIKAYAVAAKSRLSVAPDVPTVDEAGLPGFYSAPWYAFWPARRSPSSLGSMPRSWMRSRTRRFAPGSPISDRRYSRATGRRPRRLLHFTRPRSKSGDRSSRRPGSRVSKNARHFNVSIRISEAATWPGTGILATGVATKPGVARRRLAETGLDHANFMSDSRHRNSTFISFGRTFLGLLPIRPGRKDLPMLLPISDSCPRCGKPVTLSTIERHPSRRDLALHSYHCADCGPVRTKSIPLTPDTPPPGATA
jgi:tripartite-type tricarboxylate transporter receptor subunit TctC